MVKPAGRTRRRLRHRFRRVLGIVRRVTRSSRPERAARPRPARGTAEGRRSYRLGRACEKTKDWAGAAEAYAAAVASDGAPPHWHYRLGRACEKTKDWAGAAEAYAAAVAGDRAPANWYYRLGRARERAGAQTPVECFGSDLRAPDYAGGVATLGRPGVRGWVPDDGSAEPIVALVNGTPVAETYPTAVPDAPEGHPHLRFQRALRGIWRYLGDGDRLEIVRGEQRIPILGWGDAYVERAGAPSQVKRLFRALDSGSVVDKYGKVRKSIQIDDDWQESVLALFADLRQHLEREFGLDLIPFYGTLLGAVREGDFIGHDNDFDTVYVSKHSDPDGVAAEFKAICQSLIDAGYVLRVKKTHTWVRVPKTRYKVDIFFAWFDGDDRLQVSYGYHGTPVERSPEMAQKRPAKLGRHEILVPANSEALLAQLFGEGWRHPDPGFKHQSATRVYPVEYHLPPDDINALYWNQFYRDHNIDDPSPFAEYVSGVLPPGCPIVEFGCGTGRDAIYLARQGHPVLAGDRSPEAIERARELMERTKLLDGRVRLATVDVAEPDQIERFVADAPLGDDPSRVAVYTRFFLHAVDDDTQAVLLDALARSLPAGFTFCAEFRTVEDARLPKVHGDHRRRYIDEQEFVAMLGARWGFEVTHLEAGRGLSPYKDEDPFLARVLGVFPPRDA